MNQMSVLNLLCKVLSIAFVNFSWLFGASLYYFTKPFCISRAISSCPASDLSVCLPLWCAWIFSPLLMADLSWLSCLTAEGLYIV